MAAGLDENVIEEEVLIRLQDRGIDPKDFHLEPGTSLGLCHICYDAIIIAQRPCCQFRACLPCFTEYLENKVADGIVRIECPGSDCHYELKEYEISTNLRHQVSRQMFHKLLIDAQNSPTLKTCPRCGQERKVEMDVLQTKNVRKHGLPVTCESCALKWCFPCHAPWHEGVECRKFRLGDVQFREWAKKRGPEAQNNAQKCPVCKTYVQRANGCLTMICRLCGTFFCYRCSEQFPVNPPRLYERWTFLFFMGKHNYPWSPRGCPKLVLPEAGVARKLLKGFILGGKIAASITLLPVALAVAISVSPVALPVVGTIKVVKTLRKIRQHKKRQQEAL